MRRLALLAFTAIVAPACGGSGGSSRSTGSSVLPVPTVTINSVNPSSFTPPVTTTVNFTLTGQAIQGTSLSVWTPTTGTTVKLLGEIDLGVNTAGTTAPTWNGSIPMFTAAGVVKDNAPIQLEQVGTAGGNDVFSVQVRRNVQQWRSGGAGIIYTSSGIQDDLLLFLSVDWAGGTVTLVGYTNLTGDGYTFPMSPPTFFDGVNTWTYEDHIQIYQYLLDTSNGTVTYANPGPDMKWTDVGITMSVAGSGSYLLSVVSFNSGGVGESALSPVTIP